LRQGAVPEVIKRRKVVKVEIKLIDNNEKREEE